MFRVHSRIHHARNSSPGDGKQKNKPGGARVFSDCHEDLLKKVNALLSHCASPPSAIRKLTMGSTGICPVYLLEGSTSSMVSEACEIWVRSEEHTSELQSRGHL